MLTYFVSTALSQWQAAHRVWANFVMFEMVIELISQRLDESLKQNGRLIVDNDKLECRIASIEKKTDHQPGGADEQANQVGR